MKLCRSIFLYRFKIVDDRFNILDAVAFPIAASRRHEIGDPVIRHARAIGDFLPGRIRFLEICSRLFGQCGLHSRSINGLTPYVKGFAHRGSFGRTPSIKG